MLHEPIQLADQQTMSQRLRRYEVSDLASRFHNGLYEAAGNEILNIDFFLINKIKDASTRPDERAILERMIAIYLPAVIADPDQAQKQLEEWVRRTYLSK